MCNHNLGFLTPLMLIEFPVQHLWPVFVAEPASHEHIPPIHSEQLEDGEEAFPLTVRSQDHGRLDALRILSAVGISGQALEVSADLLRSARRKVAPDPVGQPLSHFGHIGILSALERSVIGGRSIDGVSHLKRSLTQMQVKNTAQV